MSYQSTMERLERKARRADVETISETPQAMLVDLEGDSRDNMDEDAFRRGFNIYARTLSPEDAKNLRKELRVKSTVYLAIGVQRMRDEDGVLRRIRGSSNYLVGKQFRDDYLDFIENHVPDISGDEVPRAEE